MTVLPTECQKEIMKYVGELPVLTVSEGKSDWNDLYISVKLHQYVDSKKWTARVPSVTYGYNIHALSKSIQSAYVGFPPFKMLSYPENAHEMEILVKFSDDAQYEVFFNDGLVVPPSLDMAKLGHLLQKEYVYTAKSIKISKVPETFLFKRWLRRVGGHGFMRKLEWAYYRTGLTFTRHELSSDSEVASELWENRKENGCSLESSCTCDDCRNDVDHSDCLDTCPFKL